MLYKILGYLKINLLVAVLAVGCGTTPQSDPAIFALVQFKNDRHLRAVDDWGMAGRQRLYGLFIAPVYHEHSARPRRSRYD